MENKHVKRCSTSDVIRKMKIKTMRCRYKPIIMTNIKMQMTPNAGEGMEQKELSFIPGEDVKWYSHFGSHFGGFLQN